MLKNCMSGISLLSLVIVGIAAGFPAPLLVHLYVAVVAPSSASSFLAHCLSWSHADQAVVMVLFKHW